MRTFSVMTSGAAAPSGVTLKSIPLRKLPPDAWTMLQGQDTGDMPASVDIVKLYERVAWLNRAVDLIADAAASVPYEFHDVATGDVPENEPEWAFELDLESLVNALAGDVLLHGCAYVHVERNAFGFVRAIRRLYPRSVKPKWDENTGLVAFERSLGSRTITLQPDEVVYIQQPNRGGEVGHGKSKAYAALRAAGFLDSIDAFGLKFFEQGALRPNIVFVDGSPTDADVQKMENFFQRMASGIRNAFRTIAVRSKVEAVTFGETPDHLEMPGLTDKKREDIATALGVPHSLLFSSAANYATARQDDLHFYDKTVQPLAKLIFRALSRGIFEPLGYELRAHPERLEIFQHLEAEKAEALAMMHDRHVIDTNEFRDAMAFERIDGLDEAERDYIGWAAARGGDEPPMMTPTPSAAPDAAVLELRAWRRWLEKRIASGKAQAREFETRHIHRSLKAALAGALSEADTPEARRAIFASAERFIQYP